MLRKIVPIGCALVFALSGIQVQAAVSSAGPKQASTASTSKAKSKKVAKRKVVHKAPSKRTAQSSPANNDGQLHLASAKALVLNQDTGEVLYAKSTETATPIASVTKLMTAMVVLDAGQPMDEPLTVTSADVDTLKGSSSRLPVGTTLSRAEMLQLALMASENRAASALGHAYPGGYDAFVRAMNAKARALGMLNSNFVEATGLSSRNVSTAEDLARMVNAAYEYPEIREVSTAPSHEVAFNGAHHVAEFRNTNILVRKGDWDIGLSKTGYISEAGRCLVMQAKIAGQPVIIVLLDSVGRFTRIGDAQRIRKWIEHSYALRGKVVNS
jgi:D-alanyl-D-alanine endopeptidase (penicillin-binding protein 7)